MDKHIQEIFGSMVFGDAVMRQKLPKDTYKSLKKTIEDGSELDISVANVVANAMKDWALEKGATHYTHWFQPMTGITAEKHDSFISPTATARSSWNSPARSSSRANPTRPSFPSGGLRATFEARGYTAWDPTSYAFIKDGTLCIPTAFCSYGGEALDKKTPLLRSMEAINRQALRVLKLFGNDRRAIGQDHSRSGAGIFPRRQEASMTSARTSSTPAARCSVQSRRRVRSSTTTTSALIKPRVAAFMKDLDEELWKLGILAKTEHNEVAPAQHELAPIFTTTNIAADHNQLTMEIMKKVATKHGLVCLLHEKPFAGVNGSGKHNNWSISTDTGREPPRAGRHAI